MDWSDMSIQEQRQRYGAVRTKLVKSGVMESEVSVDDLFRSLSTVHERPDVLKLIEQLIPRMQFPTAPPAPVKPTIKTKDDVIAALGDIKFVQDSIVLLYRQQTPQEQNSSATLLHNGAGFSARTAEYGTFLAKHIIGGGSLTGQHVERAKGVCRIHAAQIARIISNGNSSQQ
jgi:hypothetical protein